MLPTQMFLRLPARATFFADTKMFLILFRNILCPQQMLPRTVCARNNVSATMCPLPYWSRYVGLPQHVFVGPIRRGCMYLDSQFGEGFEDEG